jgi:hypothetical protein
MHVDLAAGKMYHDRSVKDRIFSGVSCLERRHQLQEGMFCCSFGNSVSLSLISASARAGAYVGHNNGTCFKEKVPCRKGS